MCLCTGSRLAHRKSPDGMFLLKQPTFFVSSCLHRLRCIASCTHANRATSSQMMGTMSSSPAAVCQKPVQSIYNQGAAHGCRSFASCMMHVLCVAVWPSKACQVGFLKTLPQQFVRPAALTGWCALFDYFVQAAKQQLDEHCRCPAFVPARRCPVLEIDRRAMCCCTINTIGPNQPRPREVVNWRFTDCSQFVGGGGKRREGAGKLTSSVNSRSMDCAPAPANISRAVGCLTTTVLAIGKACTCTLALVTQELSLLINFSRHPGLRAGSSTLWSCWKRPLVPSSITAE